MHISFFFKVLGIEIYFEKQKCLCSSSVHILDKASGGER